VLHFKVILYLGQNLVCIREGLDVRKIQIIYQLLHQQLQEEKEEERVSIEEKRNDN
jgi:hypothetical protein